MSALISSDRFLDDQTVDLVADFGGSFDAWNTFYQARTAPVRLTIPAGTYTESFPGGTTWPFGPNLCLGPGPGCLIEGIGNPTITVSEVTISEAYTPTSLHQPRFHTALAGVSSITLVIAGDTASFTVGDWVILMCIDLQGAGYPQNNFFFEYKEILSIGVGTIAFTEPLVESYYETYPISANSGAAFFPDEGGSPTIMKIHASWNNVLTVRGITVANTVAQPHFGSCREITWENCIFTDMATAPSASRRYIMRNCTMLGTGNEMEIDKNTEYLEFNNCTIRKASLQSMTIKELLVKDCVVTEAFNGTARSSTIDGCTIASLVAGPLGYGSMADSLTITDSTVSNTLGFGPSRSANMALADFTKSGNTLTLARADYDFQDQAFLVPGHWYNYNQSGGLNFGNSIGPSFQITDIAESGGNVVVTTTLPVGAIPQMATTPDPPDVIVSFQAPFITVTNSGGCPEMRIMSRAPANTQLWTYFNPGTLTGIYDTTEDIFMFGNVVSLTVNVITPYTGVEGSILLEPLGKFQALLYNDAYALTSWTPKINLKVAGLRTITPSGVTGAQAGDLTLALPGATHNYLQGSNAHAYLTNVGTFDLDISGESSSVWPEVTVEFITDLGIT